MKRRDGLVLNAGELFVYIKDIAIVATKRNSKTMDGIRGMLLTKLNKSDERNKDRGAERWEYPPGRARITPASQQRLQRGADSPH